MPAPLRIRGHWRSTGRWSRSDAYLERLLKLVPVESLGLYLAGRVVIQTAYVGDAGRLDLASAPSASFLPHWMGWTGFCLLMLVGIRRWATSDREAGVGPEWPAIAISAALFLAWVYAIGDVFAQLDAWRPLPAAILIACAFAAPAIYGDADAAGRRPERQDFKESDAQQIVMDAAKGVGDGKPQLDEMLAERLESAADLQRVLWRAEELLWRRHGIRQSLQPSTAEELESLRLGIYGRLAAWLTSRVRRRTDSTGRRM